MMKDQSLSAIRDMSEEEYAALDKRLTDTVPTLGPNGTGFFSRKETPKQENSLKQILRYRGQDIWKGDIEEMRSPR